MSPTLLSDVAGRITRVAFALPGEEPDVVAPLRDCMQGVLDALGSGVRAELLHHPEQRQAAEALARGRAVASVLWDRPRMLRFDPGRATIEDGVLRLGAPPIGDYTPWIQDTCLVARSAAGPVLLANPHVARPDGGLDADVPALLARHLGWPLEILPAPLDAANVLVDHERVVVGRDALDARPDAAEALVGRLASARSAILVVPAEGRQPAGHLDLVLALAGPCGSNDTPTAVVGSPALAHQITGLPHGIEEDRVAGLERLAQDLTAAGCRVARVPVIRRRARPEWKPGWLSWTNVLVERWMDANGTARRRVVLPAYGTDGGEAMQALDAAAAETWQGLGYAVARAEGPYTWMAVFDGGIRCLTKVLARAETERGR